GRRDDANGTVVEAQALANELREEAEVRRRRRGSRHSMKHEAVQGLQVVARDFRKEMMLEMKVLIPKEERDDRIGVDRAAREKRVAGVADAVRGERAHIEHQARRHE